MEWYDWVNLIISIISLVTTIIISITIHKIEKNDSKKLKEEEKIITAKQFLIDNADEIEFLPLCVIASCCFPFNKHIRKIYNSYSILDDDIQKEILRLAKLEIPLIKNQDWISIKLEQVKNNIHELDLGDTFLYDGAKYFHRMYDYRTCNYKEYNSIFINKNDYEDVFEFPRIFSKNEGRLNFDRYIDDYLFCKYEKNELFNLDWIKPFDYLTRIENLRSCMEEKICFYMSIVIEKTMIYSNKYLNCSSDEFSDLYFNIETFEDYYFKILLKLYLFKK